MTQKFVINTEEGLVELEYNDVKTKKLVNYCGIIPVKWLQTSSMIVFVFFILVVVYDFFKDIGRSVSATKDLFTGKEGGFQKYVGFTKGNITRLILKSAAFILALVLYYLSDRFAERTCVGQHNARMLGIAESLIKYNDQGIPVEIVAPNKKST